MPAGAAAARTSAISICSAAVRTSRRCWRSTGCATAARWPGPSSAARSCWPSAPAFRSSGESFPGSDGRQHDGVGLLPVETRRSFAGPGEPVPAACGRRHRRRRRPGARAARRCWATRTTAAAPVRSRARRASRWAVVRQGIGNGTPDRAEGWVIGRVLATYLHGPVLAQNPALADLLLRWVHPDLPELDGPAEADVLRAAPDACARGLRPIPGSGVDDERERTVVDQADPHVRTEDAGLDRRARAHASRSTTASTSGSATGPGAAAFQDGRRPLRVSA